MDEKKRLTLAALAVPLFMAAGCMANFTLQFNERTIEVERLRQASFPRGLKITYFDGKLMKLTGREAINLNGSELEVNGSTVRYGDFKGKMGPHQKLVITKRNTISIENQNPIGDSKNWWQFWH